MKHIERDFAKTKEEAQRWVRNVCRSLAREDKRKVVYIRTTLERGRRHSDDLLHRKITV